MLGEARLAAEMAEEMLKRGVYVIGMYFPVVPKGESTYICTGKEHVLRVTWEIIIIAKMKLIPF